MHALLMVQFLSVCLLLRIGCSCCCIWLLSCRLCGWLPSTNRSCLLSSPLNNRNRWASVYYYVMHLSLSSFSNLKNVKNKRWLWMRKTNVICILGYISSGQPLDILHVPLTSFYILCLFLCLQINNEASLLKDMLIALGFSKPPDGITPFVLFSKVESKVCNFLLRHVALIRKLMENSMIKFIYRHTLIIPEGNIYGQKGKN